MTSNFVLVRKVTFSKFARGASECSYATDLLGRAGKTDAQDKSTAVVARDKHR
jgi:hypothetical protein